MSPSPSREPRLLNPRHEHVTWNITKGIGTDFNLRDRLKVVVSTFLKLLQTTIVRINSKPAEDANGRWNGGAEPATPVPRAPPMGAQLSGHPGEVCAAFSTRVVSRGPVQMAGDRSVSHSHKLKTVLLSFSLSDELGRLQNAGFPLPGVFLTILYGRRYRRYCFACMLPLRSLMSI